jgi:hypothetical protein
MNVLGDYFAEILVSCPGPDLRAPILFSKRVESDLIGMADRFCEGRSDISGKGMGT